jgi:hypothetical protein
VHDHQQTTHRAHLVLKGIRDAEHGAKWAGPDADWMTDEHAVSFRALMVEWWALPNADVQAALRREVDRPTMLLTAKGAMTARHDIPSQHSSSWLKALGRAIHAPLFTYVLYPTR